MKKTIKQQKKTLADAMWKWRKIISEKEIAILVYNQHKNNCEICGKKNNYALHIDHNHKTNKIRGLLCFKCNMGLGYFNDDINLFKKAIKYLNK